ncbi:MAG: hypothetical protein LBP22_08280 [Deltaproteobacteria bacterium]|nr:hypothetical protein [Deltaproteobacteria bacterium]
MAALTNKKKKTGTMAQVLVRAGLFTGVSAPGMATGPMVRTMSQDPIIPVMAIRSRRSGRTTPERTERRGQPDK